MTRFVAVSVAAAAVGLAAFSAVGSARGEDSSAPVVGTDADASPPDGASKADGLPGLAPEGASSALAAAPALGRASDAGSTEPAAAPGSPAPGTAPPSPPSGAAPPAGSGAAPQSPPGSVAAPEAAGSPVTPPDAGTSPKRVVPDYDGRGRPPPSAGEIALWVPRVLLSPVYLTTEWLVRRPLGALISAAERANIPETLYNFFAFGPDHKAGFAPTAFVDFGFNPSIGLYGFWNDAFFSGNNLSAHVSFWTDDWIGGSLVERIFFRGKDSVQLKFLGIRRPDHVFYGIGPNAPQSAQSRYGEDKLDGGVQIDHRWWRSSRVDLAVGVRYASFFNGHYGRDPGIFQSAAAGAFPLPDGFEKGYTAEYTDALVALDSRRAYPADGSGVRLEVRAEQSNDLRQAPSSGWIHYEAGAGGFWDVSGYRRVVSLTLMALFSDPLGPRPVPFTELATLGGDVPSPGDFPAPMPGFFPGRLIDRSAAVATLRYRWPIGPWINGSLQGAVGNVFGEHLDGFDPGLLRFSGAIGIESDATVDNTFELLFGVGTETFDQRARFDSFRLAVGLTRF